MIKIKYTKKEKELIQEVIDFQVDNLQHIIAEDCEFDILLFCIEQEITKTRLLKFARKNLKKFKRVRKNPGKLFFLDSENLSIFRHILFNWDDPPTEKVKQRVWAKIFKAEKFLTYYNPN